MKRITVGHPNLNSGKNGSYDIGYKAYLVT
jgi:hypothetical protein